MSNKQGKNVILSDGRGAGGRGGAVVPAAAAAVPDDDDLESHKDMSDNEGSPKRGHEDGLLGPSKRRGGRGAPSAPELLAQPVLDLGHMELLLQTHSDRIMKAQKENLDGMMALLEERTSTRIDQVDQKTDAVNARVQSLEGQLAQALRGDRPRGGPDVDRRLTLLFGGWERDTRKPVILQQLSEALDQLDLKGHLDGEPFCTGPRRSTALAVFRVRDNESEHLTRKRMHEVILGLASSKVPIPPTGRRMFATYSKSKAERAVSNHAGWIKRAVLGLGQGVADLLDVEYNTGTCWMGQSLVGSATRPTQPGCDEKGLLREEVEGHKVWVDIGAIARESKVDKKVVERALEEDGKTVGFLEAVAGRGLRVVVIHEDTYKCLGTDHDMLEVAVRIRGEGRRRVHCTRPRVWTGGVQIIEKIDQGILRQLAKNCTKPKPGQSYRDPPEVRVAAREARRSNSTEKWKIVQNMRKKARKEWELRRIKEATAGDWGAVRKLRAQRNVGWDTHYAEQQPEGEAHSSIHNHLEKIYKTGRRLPVLPPWEGEAQAFTEEELMTAVQAGGKGKAVGLDRTSTELLQGICTTPGGKGHLLEFFNNILCTAEVPADWNRAIMVVIPKTAYPVDPGDLRPLSMGSAAAKVFARMLLARSEPMIRIQGPEQCRGKGRQCSDFVFTVSRLMQLEQEWKQGTCWLKVDLAKAFDRVDRRALTQRLLQRMGMCPEYRCWHNLLRNADAVLQTEWDCTIMEMHDGIKQGAIESPAFFSFLAETCLHEAAERYAWHKTEDTFAGLQLNNLLYMDDGLQWSRGVQGIEQRVAQWGVVLQEFGLSINAKKCQLYCSPFHTGKRVLKVQGELIYASEDLTILGLTFRVGASPSEMIAPLLAKARAKFWGGLKHLLRAKTPLGGRVNLMERVLGGTVLWPLAALPMDTSSMGLINAMQAQMCVWMMRVAKKTDESLRHPGHIYPRLMNMERDMDKDLPWASLRQLSVMDQDVYLMSWSCTADQTITTLVLAMHFFHMSLGLLALLGAWALLPLGKLVPPTFAEFGAYATTIPPSTRRGDLTTISATRAPAQHARGTKHDDDWEMPTVPEATQEEEKKGELPETVAAKRDGNKAPLGDQGPGHDGRDDPGVHEGGGRQKNHRFTQDYTMQCNHQGKEETFDNMTEGALPQSLNYDLRRQAAGAGEDEDMSQKRLEYTGLGIGATDGGPGGSGEERYDSAVCAVPVGVQYHLFPLNYTILNPNETGMMASDLALLGREQEGLIDTDVASFMQQPDDSEAWHAFLEALRSKLDNMDKLGRAVQVDYLLRRLDWHGTDTASGYFLGHMAGRTGQMTALLVAFREDIEVEPSAPAPQLAAGAWAELERFLPAHSGSNRARGRPISMEEPCVMLSSREVPSEFLTPGYGSPEARDQDQLHRRKRQCLMVEVSSGSRDRPVLTRTLRVPLVDGCGDLRFRFTVHEDEGSNTTETVAASPVEGGGTTLPVPAPDLLGEAGMSLEEYWRAEDKWRQGTISQPQLAQCYGDAVAAELVRRWRAQEHPQATTRDGERDASCSQRGEPSQMEARMEEERDNLEETVMLTVGTMMGTLGVLTTPSTGMEMERPTMDLIREHLFRQQGQGLTEREQASTLYYMMANRGCEEYLNQVPALFESIGLNVDVNLQARCLPGPTPFMTWVETELWQEFLDYYEAAIGYESDGLQALRGQEVMPAGEQDEWRRELGDQCLDEQDHNRVGTGTWKRAGKTHKVMSRRSCIAIPGTTLGKKVERGEGIEETKGEIGNALGMTGVAAEAVDERRRTCLRQYDYPEGAGKGGQATGEWLVLLGLRNGGEEQVEPQNAITRERQARARTLLTSLPERDLNMMVRALLRLTGMIYIEAARLVTQVQDTRRRNSEMVEVEVEPEQESDESMYMQRTVRFSPPREWEHLLQELVKIADKATEGDMQLLLGLRRRIESSLFLQTPRGCQLQAVLVAIGSDEEARVVPCETEENDGALLEEWWASLRAHMSLGQGEDTSARGSQDSPDVILCSEQKGKSEHDPKMVEAWEEERRELENERNKEEHIVALEQAQREEEERLQDEADQKLFQAYEGEAYKNWENWVVLNSPSYPKRRRLLVSTAEQGSDVAAFSTERRATLWVPERLDSLQIVLQLVREPDLPQAGPGSGLPNAGEQPTLDLQDAKYQKVYEAWKAGEITDRGISLIYGEDWLMLFEVMRDGAGGEETLPEAGHCEVPAGGGQEGGELATVVTTQLDDGGDGSVIG
ncbi:unnamed protein product, partial [Symbiodinium microadriaticum]